MFDAASATDLATASDTAGRNANPMQASWLAGSCMTVPITGRPKTFSTSRLQVGHRPGPACGQGTSGSRRPCIHHTIVACRSSTSSSAAQAALSSDVPAATPANNA